MLSFLFFCQLIYLDDVELAKLINIITSCLNKFTGPELGTCQQRKWTELAVTQRHGKK